MSNAGHVAATVSGLRVDFAAGDQWAPAVIDVSFAIHSGEVVALVGESGSGKSTIALAMLGLLPATGRVRGRIDISGREVTALNPRELRKLRGDRAAMIFQEPNTAFDPVYTVGYQLIETIRAHRTVSVAAARARCVELLGLVEIVDPAAAMRAYPHQLSGGQLQRAMIAQALSLEPDLLIADEPTTALDVTIQAEILALLRSLRDRIDAAILLITHNLGVVADLADRVIVLHSGRVVEQASVGELFANPRQEYTRALFAAIPQLADLAGAGENDQDQGGLDATARLATLAPSPPGAISVRLDAVSVDYAQRRHGAFRAVEEVSLEVAEHELIGLVGESGSGKTTIGRAIAGLQPISAGRLEVAGESALPHQRDLIRRLRGRVGIVFQDPASTLNPRWPVGASIGEPLRLVNRLTGNPLRARIEELLADVGLGAEFAARYPHELSGGQKQRVSIARALALNPAVLVADEPTSALDVSVQARILALLRRLHAERGFACVFISHDLAVIDAVAERVAVMQRGRIVEVGPTRTVLRHPREPYTQALIAAVPVPDPAEQARRRKMRSNER